MYKSLSTCLLRGARLFPVLLCFHSIVPFNFTTENYHSWQQHSYYNATQVIVLPSNVPPFLLTHVLFTLNAGPKSSLQRAFVRGCIFATVWILLSIFTCPFFLVASNDFTKQIWPRTNHKCIFMIPLCVDIPLPLGECFNRWMTLKLAMFWWNVLIAT